MSVQVIHREGVIHNDLKPENFVFCCPFLKLIDFGIANKIEMDHTSVERDIRCGTASYMAPETIATQEDRDVFKVGTQLRYPVYDGLSSCTQPLTRHHG